LFHYHTLNNIRNLKTLTWEPEYGIQNPLLMTVTNQIPFPKRNIWEPILTLQQRMDLGKKQRTITPREAHAQAAPSKDRADPIQLLIESEKGRVEKLVPIRYGRMLQSPFAYMRGSAIVMAEDLSHTPCSGIYVQCCGDCHLMNFGGYATPERNQVFDINDFDETLPAPFEWDVKRLVASVIIAGRYKQFSEKENRKAALAAADTYSKKIREFAMMRQLEIWYNRLDEASIIDLFKLDRLFVKRVKAITSKARLHTHEHIFPAISELKNGKRKFQDQKPLIYHPPDVEKLIESGYAFFDEYYKSLSDDRKSLLSRYKIEDIALKVVGVGSVGTHCLIGLFTANEEDAIILQFKEGSRSVLEKYAGDSVYGNHGERIVNGQRLMQTVSDIFLGWTKSQNGTEFYVRQLRDMKASANPDNFTPRTLEEYATLCGWALAKSHAKAGRSPEITGYIGKTNVFTEAVTDFAVGYANRTEKDFALLKAAEKNQRIKAIFEKPSK
jgi:uncharacterized protein (DUF2252 family)